MWYWSLSGYYIGVKVEDCRGAFPEAEAECEICLLRDGKPWHAELRRLRKIKVGEKVKYNSSGDWLSAKIGENCGAAAGEVCFPVWRGGTPPWLRFSLYRGGVSV